MEWGYSGSPRPQTARELKCAWKFLASFFGIKKAFYLLIFFQKAKLLTRNITHIYWCNWRTFLRKNPCRGWSAKGSLSCKTVLRITGLLSPRRNWPLWITVSWSRVCFSGKVTVVLPPVPWTEKQLGDRPLSADVEIVAIAVTRLVGKILFYCFAEPRTSA